MADQLNATCACCVTYRYTLTVTITMRKLLAMSRIHSFMQALQLIRVVFTCIGLRIAKYLAPVDQLVFNNIE